jgi:hypothetical protein
MAGPMGARVCGGPRVASVVRTVLAAAVLLVFWGLLVYAYWPEIVPALLRAFQSARGVGATEIESAYLDVRNNSSADQAAVRKAVAQLEADYVAIQSFLGRESDHPVPVLIANGAGPAFTDGARLNVFYDGQGMDLSTAPFFLVPLSEGSLSVADLNLFVEGGFAIYVAEETGRALPLLGQSADAWVTWFRQNGGLAPLADAQRLGAIVLPRRERDVPDAVRVLLQGGSFVRWVAEVYGLDSVQDLRAGASLADVTELSLPEAEHAWLEAVSAKALRPEPCARVVPAGSALRRFCDELGP